MQFGMGPTAEQTKQGEVNALMGDANYLINQQAAADARKVGEAKKPASLEGAGAERIKRSISEEKQSLTIDFKNVPQGTNISGSGNNFAVPNVSSTR